MGQLAPAPPSAHTIRQDSLPDIADGTPVEWVELSISDGAALSGYTDTLEIFDQYAKNFVQLNQHCAVAADFGGIFDYVQHSIFLDGSHVISLGNQIIAENVFAISLPIVSSKIDPSYDTKTDFSTNHYASNSNEFIIYAAGADFSGNLPTKFILYFFFRNDRT